MHEGAVSYLVHGFSHEFVNDFDDDVWSSFNADDVHCGHHDLFVLGFFRSPEGLHLVDLTELSERLEEFVGCASFLGLEEGEPENLSVEASRQSCVDVCRQIVVHNIFEIDVVKFIGPWMENLKAFVIHVLFSESIDVLLNELEISLICLDWVAEVILVDGLFVISQEGSNCFDARGRL